MYVLPEIICDVCKKRVGRTDMELDQSAQEAIFHVWCHGKQDRCAVPMALLTEQVTIEGVAFRTKRIGEK